MYSTESLNLKKHVTGHNVKSIEGWKTLIEFVILSETK
jgi:hypothetical protein